MYNCELCGKTQPPSTPSFAVVLAWRVREYPFRPNANTFRGVDERTGLRKIVQTDDPGGKGFERVREARVCRSCREAHDASH